MIVLWITFNVIEQKRCRVPSDSGQCHCCSVIHVCIVTVHKVRSMTVMFARAVFSVTLKTQAVEFGASSNCAQTASLGPGCPFCAPAMATASAMVHRQLPKAPPADLVLAAARNKIALAAAPTWCWQLQQVEAVAHDGDRPNINHRRYRPKSLKPAGGHTLWIGGIAINVSEQDLFDFFESCGEIEMISLQINKLRNGQFGHIKFCESETVDKAVDLSGTMLKGSAIRLDFTEDRPLAAWPLAAFRPGRNRGNSAPRVVGHCQSGHFEEEEKEEAEKIPQAEKEAELEAATKVEKIARFYYDLRKFAKNAKEREEFVERRSGNVVAKIETKIETKIERFYREIDRAED